MKLAYIEIAGFRGFRERTRFDLAPGFAVLTGRNGVGKSTILDAVDFAFTGTINKYAVTTAKGGGLAEHIWWLGDGQPEHQYVAVCIVDDAGEEFVIKRSRTSGLDKSIDQISQRVCVSDSRTEAWVSTFMRTTLIRDEFISNLSLDLPEQARALAVREAIGSLFGPDHTKRTNAINEACAKAKAAQEARVEEVKTNLGRTLNELTEARSIAERQPDVSEAEQIIRDLAPDLVDLQSERAELLRRRIADRKQSVVALIDAIAKAESLQSEQDRFQSEEDTAELMNAQSVLSTARQASEASDRAFSDAQRIVQMEQEGDTFASHMVALLQHGEALGLQGNHCPLCDAVRSSEEFARAIAAARSRLSVRGERIGSVITAFEQAKNAVLQNQRAFSAAEARVKELESQRLRVNQELQSIASIFARFSLNVSPSETDTARQLVLHRQEETARLEHALFILEASSAHDRAMMLEARAEHLRLQLDAETVALTLAERAVENARQIHEAAREVVNQIANEQFETVMPLLKELYQRLRPHSEWREIETDFGGRVRASLNFIVGDGKNPQFLFSSGQRRAAGLSFLLAMHLSRSWCRLKSLLLDDPVQHIDDYRALNLVEVLSAVRRTGHQVVIAVEDPALADVLCRRLRSTNPEMGCRFDINTGDNGSGVIERRINILPMPHHVLQAEA